MRSWSLMKLTTSVCQIPTLDAVSLTSDCVADNVCIEALSIDLTRPMLDSAARSVTKLGEKIEESVASGSHSSRELTYISE